MVRRAKQTIHKHMKHAGYARWMRALVAFVLLISLAIPAFNWIDGLKAYAISPETERVIGKANKNLSTKFSYDEQGKKWQFNKNGAAALAANIAKQQGNSDVDGVAGALSQLTAQQVGGSGKNDTSLYSVDLPVRAKDGITYYDNVNKLSFKMIPDFTSREGKLVQDRIVYPFADGGQIVYTAKSNGLKEDIVLSKYIADTLRYSYELQLPETLQAKLLDDGSVGIYSASPALFGNISFSNDEEKAKVMDARKNGTKDHLMFSIPAPFIKDQNGNAGHTKYLLNGTRLTVVASQLKNLTYPLTVDPSVTITSSSDFQNGNNEGMASFDTADQISRGGITGGTTGAWDNAGGAVFTTKRSSHASVTYNGYLYILGGLTAAATLNDVQYAAINSGGNIGAWQSTSSFANTRGNLKAVAYNGYMYILGGNASGSSVLYNDVQYAPICDGVLNTGGCTAGAGNIGKLGTWQYTYNSASSGSFVNGFSTARYGHNVQIYNGYLYVMGGCTDTNNGLKVCQTIGNDVQYAPVNANGTVGTWANANTGAAFTARFNFASAVYNGYLYVMGGCISLDIGGNCSGTTNTTQYASIGNGTLGAWTTAANTFTTARYQFSATVYNGYIYISGGSATLNDVQYAPIYANGTLGTWTTTATFNTGGRYDHAMTEYKGYLYVVGGCDNNAGGCNAGNNYLTDTRKARIDTAGTTGNYSAAATYDTAARNSFATATYNNHLYVIGGIAGTTSGAGANMLKSVRYATLNTDGSVAGWQTASTEFINTSGAGHGCSAGCPGRANPSAAAYNGYLYIAGGVSTGSADTWSDVQRATICTAVNTPVAGCTGAGDLRDWTRIFADYLTNSTTTFTEGNGRSATTMVIYNGVMYILGGASATNTVYDHIYQSNVTSTGGLAGFAPSSLVLPSARKLTKAFVVSSRLYIVGGGSGAGWAQQSNETEDVRFTSVSSTGVLGATWTDANASINGGSGSSFVAAGALNSYHVSNHNNQIYVVGGYNGTGIAQTSVYRATINTNGSVGAWSSVTNLTARRFGAKTAVVNGFLYVIGGCDQPSIIAGNDCNSLGQMLNAYQYVPINNGGGGATGSWTEGATSPGGLYEKHAAGGYASYNGYVYSLKGCTASTESELVCAGSAMSSDMHFAKINTDGTHGSWATLSTTGTPPTDRFGLSAVAYNGYLYAIGGCTVSANTGGGYRCTTFSKDIYFAQINPATGNVGTWQTTTGFDASVGRYGHTAVVYNGYMYVAGGCTATSGGACTTYENTVRVAAIDSSNGTIGVWSSAGSNFSTARLYHQSVTYGGYLYILSGCTAMTQTRCTGFASDVQFIALNSSTGAFTGGWQNTGMFDFARTNFGAVAYNGYLYVAGGCYEFSAVSDQCTKYVDNVRRTPLLAGGHAGRWEKTPDNMAEGTMAQGLVVASGYLVTMFGVSSPTAHTYYTKIRTSPINVQSRVGKYSKLLTISPTTDVAGVYYNGTLPTGSSVTYRVAPSSGVFGAITTATQGTGSEPTPLCGMGTIYYVQLMTTIDDSTTATFPESTAGNVTDMTVYYRLNATPPPNLRMTGGKWFWNETLRPLDTCKQANV